MDDHQYHRRKFVISAGLILTVTGLVKLYGSFSGTRLLAEVHPIFGATIGRTMLLTGLVEIAVALLCFCGKRSPLPVVIVAWLSGCFWVYRLGLSWMGWHRPCGCLGTLTDSLGLPPELVDVLMKVVAIYLLFGSYAFLAAGWRQPRVPE